MQCNNIRKTKRLSHTSPWCGSWWRQSPQHARRLDAVVLPVNYQTKPNEHQKHEKLNLQNQTNPDSVLHYDMRWIGSLLTRVYCIFQRQRNLRIWCSSDRIPCWSMLNLRNLHLFWKGTF